MDHALLLLVVLGIIATILMQAISMFRLSSLSDGATDKIRDEFRATRDEARTAGKELRDELSSGMRASNETLLKTWQTLNNRQQDQLDTVTKQLKELTDSNRTELDRIHDGVSTRITELQGSNEHQFKEVRKELFDSLRSTNDAISGALQSIGKHQGTQLDGMSRQLTELIDSNRASLDRIRQTFDIRVKELQDNNEKKLDEMRSTVDEKLHSTLEKRLGESFKQVSDRLEAVHQGLGEMHSLATGVGDLKRVLTNVKVRGTWAEVQLGAILEQILIRDQWEKNVGVRDDSSERVEYAIRLPGPQHSPAECVWLPLDSKFPQEDYIRLQEAAERADAAAVQNATDALIKTIRAAAKDIRDKYVNPPNTTDFAIMFLATEGLYAEVLRQPGLIEELQQQYRVLVAGPTTLAAILSSLRMGFQTLVIEQRAEEVWKVLGAVKTEFGKFGDVLDKIKRQLNTATNTLEETGKRTRIMERKLRSVQQLPEPEASDVLALDTSPEQLLSEEKTAGAKAGA